MGVLDHEESEPRKKRKSSGNHDPIESEKKRLLSVKEKRRSFKAKENLIHDALSNIDKPKNNKILFDDDDVTESVVIQNSKNSKSQQRQLFDNDDDNENNEDENESLLSSFDVNKKPEKLLKLQVGIGNDKRFVLDKRFLDEDETEATKQEDETEVVEEKEEDEKEWQLNILGDVLGKPVNDKLSEKKKQENTTLKKKGKMIRYDPLQEHHKEFELKPQESESMPAKKKKRKEKIVKVEESEPLPVSKDVFYKLSENLTETLKHDEEFSLLKTYGRKIEESNDKDTDGNVETAIPASRFKSDLGQRNPFKYDSSDDEDVEEKTRGKDYVSQDNDPVEKVEEVHRVAGQESNFFFCDKDPRFQDAIDFFKKPETLPEENFATLRRELKQIVRLKIRNNLKKKSPWGNKKKVKKLSKQKLSSVTRPQARRSK